MRRPRKLIVHYQSESFFIFENGYSALLLTYLKYNRVVLECPCGKAAHAMHFQYSLN